MLSLVACEWRSANTSRTNRVFRCTPVAMVRSTVSRRICIRHASFSAAKEPHLDWAGQDSAHGSTRASGGHPSQEPQTTLHALSKRSPELSVTLHTRAQVEQSGRCNSR